MAGDFHIVGGNGRRAHVSNYGEVRTGPYDYSTPSFKNLDVINTAYTFFAPKQNHFFVITSLYIQANKNVSAATATTVDIYEASQEDDTAISKSIYQFDMVRNDKISITPLNIQVSSGKFLNGKTGDDDILATISGYYILDGTLS
jgi:hypothetical protein